MVDSEEVERIKTDLDLVTKTAKVLAIKLEKISKRIETILSSLDQVGTQSTPTISKTASQPTSVAQTAQRTAEPLVRTPERSSSTVAYDGTNPKVIRFFESFLSQIQSLNAGKDIAEALANLRDQVMESAEVGFHPAFHEMGKHASRLKSVRVFSEDERQELIEKIIDWKARLSQVK
ncbi:MAG: hypothetical protein KAT16_04505 [Candidatus Heimdallarchaeota archaeon]|nr:hypothetical protein [Candidatus Heimdallarchaeota archaeon]